MCRQATLIVGHANASCGLLNFETQEDYFKQVIDRYQLWHARNGNSDALDGAFASLSLDGVSGPNSNETEVKTEMKASANASSISREGPRDLSVILMAMRKVREAIVASDRKDTFALRAYSFIIRATILMRHMESYHPALLHLLRDIHPVTSLTASELHEFVGFYMLDLSCRQNDLATACKVGCRYGYKDDKVNSVLKAIIHRNYYAFWKVKSFMSSYQQRLLEYGEEAMRRYALECLGKSYLSVDRDFLERSTQRVWEELKDDSGLNWQLEEGIVTIRRIKRR